MVWNEGVRRRTISLPTVNVSGSFCGDDPSVGLNLDPCSLCVGTPKHDCGQLQWLIPKGLILAYIFLDDYPKKSSHCFVLREVIEDISVRFCHMFLAWDKEGKQQENAGWIVN